MRIAHLADIHVKDRRRDEYATVFEVLAAQLGAEDPRPDVIAIAGDVFHTMSKASAHNWEDVATLLGLLADIAPVVVIPGNHDLNVRVAGSRDLIGPMLEAGGGAKELQPPRVTYWKASGVYKYAGAIWVIGIPGQEKANLDEIVTALAAAPPGTPLVGLYHESVGGALYPNGMEVRETPLTPGDLGDLARAAGPDRACAILLGDIHLQQEVSFRGSGPAAAAWYSGSLVCQDFGEPHLGHGYLLWDLEVCPEGPRVQVVPCDVPNPQAKLTISLGPNGEDLTRDPRPDHPRAYRVVHDPVAPPATVQAAVERATAIYRFPPSSVEPQARARGPQGGKIQAYPDGEALEAADWGQHETFAREILAGVPQTFADAAVARYRKAVAAKLGGGAAAPRAELLRLEFDNMFCYGPGNIVNFEALRAGRPGLVGVMAPNRAGKSSLFDVLTFALCDEVPRGSKPDVSRRGSTGYRLQLTFKIDGVEGRLEKSGMRGRSPVIRLWLEGRELTDDTAPKTAALARTYLGSRLGIEAVAFHRPSEVSGTLPFALMKPGPRREALSALLDLGAFKRLLKEADAEIAGLRGEHRVLLRSLGVSCPEGEVAAQLAPGVEAKELARVAAANNHEAAVAARNEARQVFDLAKKKATIAVKAESQAEANSLSAATRVANCQKDVNKLRHKLSVIEAEARAAACQEVAAQVQPRPGKAEDPLEAARLAPEAEAEKSDLKARKRGAAEELRDAKRARAGPTSEALSADELYDRTARFQAKIDALGPEPEPPGGLLVTLSLADLTALATGTRPVEPSHEEMAALIAAHKMTQSKSKEEEAGARDRVAAHEAVCRAVEAVEKISEAYTGAVGQSPEIDDASAQQPDDAKLLYDLLTKLEKARDRAAEHEHLRDKICEFLVEGCPGCRATDEALGAGAVAEVKNLRERAAAVYPGVAASLSKDVEKARAKNACMEKQIQKAVDARKREALNAEKRVAAAREQVQSARVWDYASWYARRDGLVAQLQESVEAELDLAEEALATAQATAASANQNKREKASIAAKAEAAAVEAETSWTTKNTTATVTETAATRAAEELGTYRKAVDDAVAVDEKVTVCAAYRKILHPKDGIGARLLQAAVTGVEAKIKDALLKMEASFTVKFTAELELTLIDQASGTCVPPALGSGYQQFVIALASRWALARVARVPLPNCFMIDEGFGCLDDENLPRVAEALGALALDAPVGRARPPVLAVTHREDMAPYFTQRLEIVQEKDRDGQIVSRVTFPPGATRPILRPQARAAANVRPQ